MNNFKIKSISEVDICKELDNIGFDYSYISSASNKYKYLNLKIYDLTLPQANILKQTALSLGADCAVNKDVLTAKIKNTDCILGGSISQIKKIINSLKNQQFSMSLLAENIESFIENDYRCKNPKIVGILNLTKNSFSDGGLYYVFEDAVRHLNQMIDDGADIIDLGAESTSPYSNPVSSEEQLEKLEPVLKYINNRNINIPISVDTRSALVAEKVIDLGASIINDVSGFDYDKSMPEVIARNDVKVIIQHSLGTPDVMQINPQYDSIVDEIYLDFANNKLKLAEKSGIKKENIIIDVGIGFGKTKEQNFELIKRIEEFKSLNCQIMLGISRKSLLSMEKASNEEKDIFTVALNALAIERNVDYLRVHNVGLNRKLVNLMQNL